MKNFQKFSGNAVKNMTEQSNSHPESVHLYNDDHTLVHPDEWGHRENTVVEDYFELQRQKDETNAIKERYKDNERIIDSLPSRLRTLLLLNRDSFRI